MCVCVVRSTVHREYGTQVPPYYTVCVGVLYTPLGTAPGSGVRVKCEIVEIVKYYFDCDNPFKVF